MENSKLWEDPPAPKHAHKPTHELAAELTAEPPVVEARAEVTPFDATTFQNGFAAQAAAVASWKYNARRGALKGNADMTYGIMKTIYGPTMRSRPLIIAHLMTPAGAPKVGVVESTAPEQYSADGLGTNVIVPQWRNGFNADIAGGTGVTYTPVAGDVGKPLSVAMTPATASRAGIAFVSDPSLPVIP